MKDSLSKSEENGEGKFSWKRTGVNGCYKILDYTCFNRNNSQIDQNFFDFFGIPKNQEINKTIKLTDWEKNSFKVNIDNKTIKYRRGLISWGKDFEEYLKSNVLNWEEIKRNEQNEFPRLHFYKKDKYKNDYDNLDITIITSESTDYDIKLDFKQWMKLKTKLSNSSIKKYLNVINEINLELIEQNIIQSPLDEIDSIEELEDLKNNYFLIPENKEKNKRGNNMYSSGFNNFISYKKSSDISPLTNNIVRYNDNDIFKRTTKKIREDVHNPEHILRWEWIGFEGKSFKEINSPNSGYRKTLEGLPNYNKNSRINHHLRYDIEKVGMIEMVHTEPKTKEKIWSDFSEGSKEGKERYITQKSYERDGVLPKIKKLRVLEETGSLKCEVCNFDFYETYGKHGENYIECHHLKPVSKMKDGDETKLSDLSLICSNCHRMIHRDKDHWLTLDELRNLIDKK